MHRCPPIGLPVDAHWRETGRHLRPGGDGGLYEGIVRVVVARGTTSVGGCQRGRPRRGGYDVDGGGRRGGGVVVDGGWGGDGGGVVVAQLLPQAVLHVLVAQRRRVADLVL